MLPVVVHAVTQQGGNRPGRLTTGEHSGDAGVCLWAVHGATELQVFTVVAFPETQTLAEVCLQGSGLGLSR